MGKKGTPSFLEATLVLMVIVLGIATPLPASWRW